MDLICNSKLKYRSTISIFDLFSQINEYLKEFELSVREPVNIPLGLKEILKSAPEQVKIPTELLNWVRQSYIEGIRVRMDTLTLESLIRTIAIKEFYSPLQIQSAIDRVKLELQNRQPNQIKRICQN